MLGTLRHACRGFKPLHRRRLRYPDGLECGPEFVYHMGDIVKKAGLYNGCSFHDCGHVEAIRGTHNRAPNLYAAMEKFKAEQSTANYQP